MGQLLVVVHHTDNSPSLCYEPELIPDPEQIHLALGVLDVSESTYRDLGSVGNRKRPMRNASTFLLIPDPTW